MTKEDDDQWNKFWDNPDNPLKNRASRGGIVLSKKKESKNKNDIEDIIYYLLNKKTSHVEIAKEIGKQTLTEFTFLSTDDIIELIANLAADINKKIHKLDKISTDLSKEDKEANELLLKQHPLYEQAKKIYESGEFINYCKKAWDKVWYHDEEILHILLMAGANHRVLNSDEGLHIFISGNTQIGKTKGGRKALKFIPQDMRIDKTFSKMWIFYAYDNGELKGKQFLFSDESKWDEEVAAIYRSILTAWDEGSNRGVVMEGGKTRNLRIPPRITLISTATELMVRKSDEGQDESRYTILEIIHSKDEEKQIKKFLQLQKVNIDKEMEIINIIWSLIPECEVEIPWIIEKIRIPKRNELGYNDHTPENRELLKYMSMLKAKALLSNKKVVDNDDKIFVDNFLSHTRLMIEGNIAGPTNNEKKVKEYLDVHAINTPIPISSISKGLKIPHSRVYDALRGKDGSFERPTGGLITKYPEVNLSKNDRNENYISISKDTTHTNSVDIENKMKDLVREGLLKSVSTEELKEMIVRISENLEYTTTKTLSSSYEDPNDDENDIQLPDLDNDIELPDIPVIPCDTITPTEVINAP